MHTGRINLEKKEKTEQALKLWREECSFSRRYSAGTSVEMVERIASLLSAGPFCFYIYNYFTSGFDFVHPHMEEVLGINPEDFTFNKYLKKLHPQDVQPTQLKERLAIHFFTEYIPPQKIPHYKVSYVSRIAGKKGGYKTILHQGIPLSVREDHKIEQLIVVFSDISFLNVAVDHKISFIGLYGEPSWFCLDPKNPEFVKLDLASIFTKRELEILSLLAEGKNSLQIADDLKISPETVRTHRRNILHKTNCRSTTELIAKCVKERVIK